MLPYRSEEHTSELQSLRHLVCRLLLEKKKKRLAKSSGNFLFATRSVLSVGLVFALSSVFLFFFFNDTATTEIYTLSLHDALPICFWKKRRRAAAVQDAGAISCD